MGGERARDGERWSNRTRGEKRKKRKKNPKKPSELVTGLAV